MIREVTVQDSSAISTISHVSLGYPCEEMLVKSKIEHLEQAREKVFVAQIEGKVVGYIHVEIYDVLYFERMANILGLAVDPEYQKRGIGKQLIKAAEAWAKNQDAHTLRLNSGMNRKEAHQFYRAVGFDQEKEQIRFLKQI